jgi:acetyl-CoA decarbonylase/synthase complex subunit delta
LRSASGWAEADLIKDVLKAVGVPLIVTGTNHFEKNNAVMKRIAETFAGENLLLNWAETDNYKTIAAAAMGYNHCIVAQAPIDVNMSKQLNILLTNMGVAPEKIVIGPYTGALGYGLEYTYSVMERIRTSAFAGDAMFAMPMVTAPGYEVARTKESKAPVSAFRMTYVDLSSDPRCMDGYVKAMFLPHTDSDQFPGLATALGNQKKGTPAISGIAVT